ncbi:MAG: VOC family protein [Cyclobacteriaceae bacterium]|nr:VOC family protein [Cyclobacteriaceae bacterium]
MKRATGLGGVFFKTKDPQAIKQWYETHLGMKMDEWGFAFKWIDPNHPQASSLASTAWSPFPDNTSYFAPSDKSFMINYRVANLEALLAALKAEGVEVVGEMQVYSYGKFGWILDPDGNKIELWEPKDEGFENN